MKCNYCNIVPEKTCIFCIICGEYYCRDNCGHMLIDMKLPYCKPSKICLDHITECVECGENRALKTRYECLYCDKSCNSICLECLYQKQWKIYRNCYYDSYGDYGECLEMAGGNNIFTCGDITMICSDCTKITYECEICGKDYCKGCKNECYICGLYICQDCYSECETCNKEICRDCTLWLNDNPICPYDLNSTDGDTNDIICIYKKLLWIKDKEIENLENVKSENKTLQTENETLQEENQRLKLELEFVPGGSGYQIAKKHFESLASNV